MSTRSSGRRRRAAAPADETPAAAILALPSRATIAQAATLRDALMARLDEPGPVQLDGAAVEETDTATVQLLAAFFRDRRDVGREVVWTGASEALQKAAALLGLRRWLGFVPGAAS